MKKKLSYIITVFVLAISLMSGCGQTTVNDPESLQTETKASVESTIVAPVPEKNGLELKNATIKYYTEAAMTKLELDNTISEFNKEYPDIKVEYSVIPDDYATKIKLSIVAGEQIDVFSQNLGGLNRAIPDTMYMPLDEIAKEEGYDLEENYGAYLKQFQVNGKTYGLPKFAMGGTGFVYNKKHFDEAQIPYPTPDWTWDDFIEASKKLMINGSNGKTERYGAFDWTIWDETSTGQLIGDMALHAGWEIVKEDGSPNIDDPRLKKTLEFYYTMMVVDKSMPTIAETKAKQYHYMYDMYKGKWSMCLGFKGSNFLDVHLQNGNLPKEDDDSDTYASSWMPRYNTDTQAKISFDQAVGDCVSATTKFKNEAYIFAKWHSTQATVLASKIVHRIPTWTGADINVLKDNFKYFKNKEGQITEGKYRTQMQDLLFEAGVPIYPVNTLKYTYSNSLRDILGKHVTLLLLDKITIDECIDNVNKEVEEVYNKAKAN